ncbi:MAG: DUF853 family protein [Candidatus Nanoarchaeia archaeon]|nr:DUF853 family protein [Candidatus Nanoarchaeia archaeon]
MKPHDIFRNRALFLIFMLFLLGASLFLVISLKTFIGYVAVISEAGTITELLITKVDPTYNWHGFYGLGLMVQGYDELQWEDTEPGGIKSVHLIFDCLEPDIEHEIYSSDVDPDTLDWTTITAGNTNDADNYFGINPASDDSISSTFTTTGSVDYGDLTINNVPMTYTKKYGEEDSTEFDYGLLDVDGVPVFFTHIATIQQGFNNQKLNYQLIVPSPIESTFYFYTDPNDECPEGMGIGDSGEGNIHGYATDNSTGQIMEDVKVSIGDNIDYSDNLGFYNITTIIGVQYLVATHTGYYTYTALVNISLGGSLTHNISMEKIPDYITNGTINGTVVDNRTGNPLANITIHIAGVTLTTDENGNYHSSVYAGNFTLAALLQGYETHIGNVSILAHTTTTYDFAMEPTQGTVEGFVANSLTGQPVEGTNVKIKNKNATTNLSGYYSITVDYGENFIVAIMDGYETYVEEIEVIPGQTTQHNISLIPSPEAKLNNGTIFGTVKDNETGLAIENASITISGITHLTDSNGFYNISIYEGTYNLVSVKGDYENYIAEVNITAYIETEHNISMDLYETKMRDGILTGNVTNQYGVAVAGVRISVAGVVVNSSSSGTYNMTAPSGAHNLVATREGYENYFAEIVISKDNTTYHNIIMSPSIVEIIQEGVGEGVSKIVEQQRPQIFYPKREGEIDYTISISEIVRKLRIGSFVKIPVSIFNYRDSTINVDIYYEGNLDNLISIDKNNMNILPDENGEFTVTLMGNVDVGIYEGKIIISGDIEGEIPVTVLVYSKEKLPIEGLLIDLNILTNKVVVGNLLKYRIDLQNLIRDEVYDITIVYKIQSENGNETIIYEDDAQIQTSLSILKNFRIPENFKEGNYVLIAEVHYLDVVSRKSEPFKVVLPFYNYSFIGIPVWIIMLVALIISSLVFFLIFYRRKKQEKQRYQTKIRIELLPKAGDRSAFVGNIAETNIRSYLDLDNFQIHTLIAGASGSGKTVVAQDMVEEALAKNVAVIVFDPTGQWTGFLRKNEDKKMLDEYAKFGMSKKNARPFSGNIHHVKDGREIIDFKKYMNPGSISVFLTGKLDMENKELFVANTIKQVFSANLPESQELKYIIIYDGIHTLLPKFGGSGKVFVQIERATREFRKWGVGLILISQVLSDFPKEVLANINTAMQMRTRDEGDLNRVKEEYGENILKSLVKSATGTSMIENAAYNNGQPYFVSFRPTYHNLKRLEDEDLKNYDKYNNIVEDIEYQLEQLKEMEMDTFDFELELKLAKDKLNSGSFNMVSIYLDGLTPRLKDQWEKLGKTPKQRQIKLADEKEIEKELENAKKENQEVKEQDKTASAAQKKQEEKNTEKDDKNPSENKIDDARQIISKISELLHKNEKKEAKSHYNNLVSIYKELSKEQKKEIFNKINEITKELK